MGTIYPGAPGATDRQACARSHAEQATSNTTEEANNGCRTPDDSTAEDEHSGHNQTNLAPKRTPAAGHAKEPRDERISGAPSWMASLRL